MTHSSNETRPDPDALLARIQADEQARQHGHLKIFLGYAAGVGKTYAMLEAAQQRKTEGIDIVVGLVETHGRVETELLLAGLEIIPRKIVNYRGVQVTEMDFDAVLQRQPEIVVVDELAHTNAPGSIHPKRYLDIVDLLDAGIDVYTTLNIQHVESLNDIVAQITGVTVKETVPDKIIDEASEIELIDLPPEELLKRLEEGKVYVPEQAVRAIQMFFRKGNLTALREMSLRRTAERVEDQMQDYMRAKSIAGPWAAGERLMVCVSPNPFSERLIRSTRRLAGELNCPWYAIYVETPAHARLSDKQREQVARTLQLADELGATTSVLTGATVDRVLIDYARQQNVTRLVIGKPYRPTWQEWLRGSLVNKIIAASGKIDVFVVSGEASESPSSQAAGEVAQEFRQGFFPHKPLDRYIRSFLLVGLATLLGLLFRGRVEPTNLVMIYLLGLVIAAVYLGRGPAVVAAILSVLAFDYFFIPPYQTFAVSDTQYLITFAAFLLIGLVISQLAATAREQALAAQRREAETASLYGLSRDLAAADSLNAIVQAIQKNIERNFERDVVVYLPSGAQVQNEHVQLVPYSVSEEFIPGENDIGLANWAFQHGQAAGRGTNTLPAAAARYLPLKASQMVIGVLAVRPHDPSRHLPPDRQRLLETFASQTAVAIERAKLAEKARETTLLQATEKLQTALLNSISHDLRTPLVSITGVLTSLDEHSDGMDEETRRSLVATARDDADRLNRLVGNLLSMTRIESGSIKLIRQPGDMLDAIGTALELVGSRLNEYPVSVSVGEDLPLVCMDFSLIIQVLINVIDNAVKYSAPGSPIEIRASLASQTEDSDISKEQNVIRVEVSDRGVGIPEDDLERIFDKFYRVQRPEQVSGTGLGLSISKGIVEAHYGQIAARQRPGGGVIILIDLPTQSDNDPDSDGCHE